MADEEDLSFPKSSYVYAFLKQNSSEKVPGFQVTYDVDPCELLKGEYLSFLDYLTKQTLHIDLWNGQSLLYFGTVAVPLKHFCRQGKEAVVSNLEIDIWNYEFPDESLSPNHVATTAPIGKLHLRLANIRHPLTSKALEKFEDEGSVNESVIIQPSSERNTPNSNTCTVSQARKLAEIDPNLSRLLSSRGVERKMSPDPALTEEKRRKLARMEAVRNRENNEQPADGLQSFFLEKQRDLSSIHSYIERNKPELIQSFLQKSLTRDKILFPNIGAKSFFEFVLENPHPDSKKVEVVFKADNLSLVTDVKLWQHLRQLHGMSKKVEPLAIADSSQDTPVIVMQPKAKIHVPFYYQCYSVQSTPCDWFKAVSGHYFTTDVLSSIPTLSIVDSPVKVKFLTEDRSPLGILNLNIQPLPPSFTHTFKFLAMEHSMFKKSIQVNKDNADFHISVKCSHPEVVCTAHESEDTVNVHIKAPTKSAGKCSEFSVFLYKDKHQVTPFQTWSVSVCPLQRVDLLCIAGQLMRSSLLIRGSHATQLVRCSSSSSDLLLHPSDPFVLSPFSGQELSMNFRSLTPGTKHFQITLVNQSLDQVIQSWLLVLSSQKPTVSKAFQVHLSLGKETAKRITYTNPYPQDRRLVVHCSHPHLLRMRETEFSVEPGQGYSLGLYFVPQARVLQETVFLYLNDASTDKNEDTYCIKVLCQ